MPLALIGPGTSDPVAELAPELVLVAAELVAEDELLLLLLLLPHPTTAAAQSNETEAVNQLLLVRILVSFVDTPRRAAYATRGFSATALTPPQQEDGGE